MARTLFVVASSIVVMDFLPGSSGTSVLASELIFIETAGSDCGLEVLCGFDFREEDSRIRVTLLNPIAI